MDSGLAALLGSAIGFLGSIVGTVVVPFFTRRAEMKRAEERERIDALREVIPPLLERGATLIGGKATIADVAAAMKHVAQLELWLSPDEWQVGRIAMIGCIPSGEGKDPKRYAAMATVLPAWVRGEYTPGEAAAHFTEMSGVDVTRIIPITETLA